MAMPSDPRLNDPKAIAALGEKIYAEKYREEFERLYRGHFAAVDVTSQLAFHAPSPEDAIREARQSSPRGVFHIIRIGEPGAFRVSYSARVASRNRIPA
jgi:hypothetical protein